MQNVKEKMLKIKIIRFNMNWKKIQFELEDLIWIRSWCISLFWGRRGRRSTTMTTYMPLSLPVILLLGSVSAGNYATQATKHRFFRLVSGSFTSSFQSENAAGTSPFGLSMWMVKPGRLLSSKLVSSTKWAARSWLGRVWRGGDKSGDWDWHTHIYTLLLLLLSRFSCVWLCAIP